MANLYIRIWECCECGKEWTKWAMNNEPCGKVTCCATCSRNHMDKCARCFADQLGGE